jgi:putative ABC transport system ATP-binding protein
LKQIIQKGAGGSMLIEGSDLSLIYDIGKEQETYAVRNANIKLNYGEVVGVVGPSGSGKSSLLYLLSGLKSPTLGTVYYRDSDLESLSEQERSALRKNNFGFIFQRHFLIDYLTIFDNVLLASNEKNLADAKDRTSGLLKRLGLERLAPKRPAQLSVGQRQKVAIARALINNPSIIFADEPTASLDHEAARSIMDMLEENREKTAIVVVTHDKSILGNADKVIEMWDGYIKC